MVAMRMFAVQASLWFFLLKKPGLLSSDSISAVLKAFACQTTTTHSCIRSLPARNLA